MEITQRIDPQPPFPISAVFHGTTEYGSDEDRWYYQHVVSDAAMPEFAYNESVAFEDPDQPGCVGSDLDGDIITSVRCRWNAAEQAYFWIIETR